MIITIITDNTQSWYIPFGKELQNQLVQKGHLVTYVHTKNDISQGDICFILSCTKIIANDVLCRNRYNIVIHASDLPSGRGWSPLQWQILEGKKEIILTMFEAVAGMDEGPYYLKSRISLDGTELLPELHQKMADQINKMCIEFVEDENIRIPKEQIGSPTYYRKRNEADDELDINKPLVELFDHLRIADNDYHPVYFNYLGEKYYLKIYRDNKSR